MVEAVIPKLDETTQVATVERWLVREGERVEQGQAICEVETDKALVQVEAPAAGTLRRQLIAAGTEVPPLTVVALVGDPGEPVPAVDPVGRTRGVAQSAAPNAATPNAATPNAATPNAATPDAATPDAGAPTAGAQAAASAAAATPAPRPPASPASAGPVASPRARRLAAELGVDLGTVSGTGPGGKITDRDVRRAAGS